MEYIDSKEGKLAKNTIEAYRTILSLLTEFINGKRFQVKEIDLVFMNAFEKWLKDVKDTSRNSAIQRTRFILTVLNYCEKEKGLDVSRFRNYKERPSKKRREEIVTLNPEELQKIKDLIDLPPHLENARKWLIFSTEVGQRGGDVLNLTPSNIKDKRLRLTQMKTGKNVVIPLSADMLELMEAFPEKRAVCTLSRNIKKLCELAKIDTPVVVRRKVDGVETLIEVPKYQVVATHVGRRSYATNHYGKLHTSLIMSVTKHSTEKQLIEYVGGTDEDVADAYQKEIEKLKRDEKS
jgi:integrase